MATVELWTFVNMFVTENFAVILAVAELPTRLCFGFWAGVLFESPLLLSPTELRLLSLPPLVPLLSFISSEMQRFEEET